MNFVNELTIIIIYINVMEHKAHQLELDYEFLQPQQKTFMKDV